jgi:hypothetical protein
LWPTKCLLQLSTIDPENISERKLNSSLREADIWAVPRHASQCSGKNSVSASGIYYVIILPYDI